MSRNLALQILLDRPVQLRRSARQPSHHLVCLLRRHSSEQIVDEDVHPCHLPFLQIGDAREEAVRESLRLGRLPGHRVPGLACRLPCPACRALEALGVGLEVAKQVADHLGRAAVLPAADLA